MLKVFVIILNYNGWEDTIDCVKSISKIRDNIRFDIETIVIDNASTNNSVEKINKNLSEVTLLENPTNLGFTGGCNEGMRYALKNGADFVLLLNNDTIVDPHLIDSLLDSFDRGLPTEALAKVGAAVPKIYFEKGYEFHKEKYKKDDQGRVIWYAGGDMDWKNLIGKNIGVDEVDHGQFDASRETKLATGCCILIKKDVLNKIGLFDDRYFLYYEDADLSQRVRSAGYKIMYEPQAIVWHKNAESSGVGSSLHDYYISRNRLLFGLKYAPVRTKIALARESLKLFRTGREWQKIGVRDFYKKRFGRGSFKI